MLLSDEVVVLYCILCLVINVSGIYNVYHRNDRSLLLPLLLPDPNVFVILKLSVNNLEILWFLLCCRDGLFQH
jgi:hypothetical protein